MSSSMLALGLMSGTSLDGVDAALVKTDGVSIEAIGEGLTLPYRPETRMRLRELLAGRGDILAIEQEITLHHAEAVELLLDKAQLEPCEVDVIGFHGQTIIHRPLEQITQQIGNGALLAERTGISVISDFRRRDMAAGGQGAPLVPLYHAAIAGDVPKPIAVVNIGGVANVTWVGDGEDILAFDTGPGNALIDDWVQKHTGKNYDEAGALAAGGDVHEDIVAAWLAAPFFDALPPKSLDRNSFSVAQLDGLSPADGAATLTVFTAQAIKKAADHFPSSPKEWVITGGGRHNESLMKILRAIMPVPVEPVEKIGYSGDMLEAQAFAFLAVRSLYKMPLSLPSTTGVTRALTGGAFYQA